MTFVFLNQILEFVFRNTKKQENIVIISHIVDKKEGNLVAPTGNNPDCNKNSFYFLAQTAGYIHFEA